MTVGVSHARWIGASVVACASTGNTSASVASYAAAADLPSVVFVPEGKISVAKLAQAIAYGARISQVRGDFDAAHGDGSFGHRSLWSLSLEFPQSIPAGGPEVDISSKRCSSDDGRCRTGLCCRAAISAMSALLARLCEKPRGGTALRDSPRRRRSGAGAAPFAAAFKLDSRSWNRCCTDGRQRYSVLASRSITRKPGA